MRRVVRAAALLAVVAVAGVPLAGTAQPAAVTNLETISGLIEAGRLEAAEAALRDLLSRSENPFARDLLGVVLSRQGRYDEAEPEFRKAIAGLPEPAIAHQHLARLYLAQQRPAQAAAELRAAARLKPLPRDLGLQLAALERAAGDLDAAAEQFRAVAERHDSVRALLELARIAAGRRDYDTSLGALRQALQLAPNSEAVLRAHAEVSMAAGAPIPAAWTLEPLARMHPEVTEYPYLLGVARLAVADSAGAAEALRRALALDPQRPLTLIALGLARNNQKQFDEAREVLTRALRLQPDNPEALAALAQAEEGRGELKRAERHARRALDRSPGHPLAQLVIGMVSMKRGDYAAAREALGAAIAGDPRSVKAHYQLSLAYARLGDRESSARHLALYREAFAELEEARKELYRRTGVDEGGM